VVDEVLAVGDAQFQKKCLGKMGEVAKGGRTVLFVSHNMRSINDLCPMCILLDGGTIIKNGKTNDVIDTYLSIPHATINGVKDLTGKSLRKNSLDDSLFKWKRIELINSRDIKTAKIKLNEPFTIKIIGKLCSSVNNMTIGFSVDSVLGFALFNSLISGSYSLDNCSPTGDAIFLIKFDQNYLVPGLYTISVGANGDKIIDWIPEAIQLQIGDLTTEGTALNPKYGGVIVHPCIWEVPNAFKLTK
jgi:lipopolysaccharide transport system ATP-binding protein